MLLRTGHRGVDIRAAVADALRINDEAGRSSGARCHFRRCLLEDPVMAMSVQPHQYYGDVLVSEVKAGALIAAAADGSVMHLRELLVDEQLPLDAQLAAQALEAAACHGQLRTFNALLSCERLRARSYLPDSDTGARVLAKAIIGGNNDIITKLLDDSRIDPSGAKGAPIRVAAKIGDVAVARQLLRDRRVDPCVLYTAPLYLAARHGHRAMVDLLLRDPRVGADSVEAAMGAVVGGHVDLVEKFIQGRHAARRAAGSGLLKAAAERGQDDVVDMLLSQLDPADIERYGSAALCAAARAGHESTVQRLLREEDVDAAFRDCAAARAAAALGHMDALEELLADPRVEPDEVLDAAFVDRVAAAPAADSSSHGGFDRDDEDSESDEDGEKERDASLAAAATPPSFHEPPYSGRVPMFDRDHDLVPTARRLMLEPAVLRSQLRDAEMMSQLLSARRGAADLGALAWKRRMPARARQFLS